jgi:parvulin-like peptidyl-prolyl isomerase
MKTWWILPAVAGLASIAACAGTESNEGIVARVGEYTLSVDDAVELLVDVENLPAQTEVVRALADIWVDYTLLAQAVARDSTLSQLELEPLVRDQLGQEVIFQLRDSVIQVDTVISDDDLRRIYEGEAPDARLRARHILLTFPQQASQAQRDSVRSLMEEIRTRVLGGGDFASLARQYSQDPGSAVQGGDLGEFGRGDMVRPFEEAAFALEPGEVSDIVESPFGLHLIRLEGKEVPGFEQVRDQFRNRVRTQRFLSAESAYVAGLEAQAAPRTSEGAYEVLKELARDPGVRLSGRAADRPLVSFEGGALTVGEYRHFMQTRQQQFRDQVVNGTDQQLEAFLRGLVQRELLLAEARVVGLDPPRARVDSLVAQGRAQLLSLADEIGLRRLDRAPGEDLQPAISRAVHAALQGVVTGAADVVPLGQIGFQLRNRYPATIYDAGVGRVLLEVGEIRAARSPSPAEAGPDTLAAPDSIGG